MINNSARPALRFIFLISGICGCGQAHAGVTDPLQGVVEYDDRVLGFELGGRVQEIAVERGQLVAPGAPLVRLDDGLEKPLRDLRAADLSQTEAQLGLLRAGARGEDLRASEAEISALQAQEELLQKNVTRQQRLVEESALAQSVVDDAASQLQNASDRRRALEERLKALRSGARGEEIAAAVARVQGARASLAAEDARLSRFELRCPAAGSVVDIHLEVGEMAAPMAPAVTIADLAHPYVDVFVPQARAPQLHVGDAMRIRVDGLPDALPGKIEHVFPKTEFTPRFLFSEAERPNLVLRMRVRVDDPKQQLHGGLPAFVRPASEPQP
jgi:HlyD family secretion protein